MERKGRCKKFKSSICRNHKISTFCDHNTRRAFDQKGPGFTFKFLEGFACFSRRMTLQLAKNHDGRDAF